MPNQTVKNGLKAKKIKLPQMNFFLKKQLIKSSCTYWLLSFCKIFLKIFRPIHKMFLVQTIIFTFIYLLALFTMQNLKKFLKQIQSYEDAPFLRPKWSICPKHNFFLKIINIILIYLLAISLGKILKIFFQQIQSYEDAQFLSPK